MNSNPGRNAIADFREDIAGIRESYLSLYALEPENRQTELSRWDAVNSGRYESTGGERLFLFPEIYSEANLCSG